MNSSKQISREFLESIAQTEDTLFQMHCIAGVVSGWESVADDGDVARRNASDLAVEQIEVILGVEAGQ